MSDEVKVTPNAYFRGGTRYSRITDVLRVLHDDSLEEFQRRVGFNYYDEMMSWASQKGTMGHTFIDHILQGCKVYGIPSPLRRPLAYADKWFAKTNFTPSHIEMTLFSDTMGVAGTIDCTAVTNENKALCGYDWKFTSQLRCKNHIQCGGYSLLLEENGIKIDKYFLVRPHRKGIQIKEVNLDKAKKAFLNCLELFNYEKEKK